MTTGNTEQENEKNELIYQTQKEAAEALDVSVEELKKIKGEPWFPELGFVTGKGWCIDLIKAARAMNTPNPEPNVLIEMRKFGPVCPKSEHHKARVKRTRGKIRECVCDDCGREWTQAGEYPDVRSETLHRLIKFLESAPRTTFKHPETGQPVKVVLIEDSTVKNWIRNFRGAIVAKQ